MIISNDEKVNDAFNVFTEPTIWSVNFSYELRSTLDSFRENSGSKNLLDYSEDYNSINLLVEPLGDLYCAYLKDYEFGYIKGFDKTVFIPEEGAGCFYDKVDECLEDLLKKIESHEINLDSELYNYYHEIPEEGLKHYNYLKDAISIKEAARLLGKSESRVQALIDNRQLDAYRYQGRVYINPKSVLNRADGGVELSLKTVKTMTPEMTEACYDAALMVIKNTTNIQQEKFEINRKTGMNPRSAEMYISAVIAMIEGEEIINDINKYSVEFYLNKIGKDFGKSALITACNVCLERFKETQKRGNTCWYYKNIAEKILNSLGAAAVPRINSDSDDKTFGSDIAKEYENYLVDKGYKQLTPSGNPSTVPQYVCAVDEIRQRENLEWCVLLSKADEVCARYDIGGSEQSFGERGHNTYRCAMRTFRDFVRVDERANS